MRHQIWLDDDHVHYLKALLALNIEALCAKSFNVDRQYHDSAVKVMQQLEKIKVNDDFLV